MPCPRHHRLPRLRDAASQTVVDRGDGRGAVTAAHQEHRAGDPGQLAAGQNAGTIAIDRGSARLDQVDPRGQGFLLRGGQAVPATPVAPNGCEGPRRRHAVAGVQRVAVGAHMRVILHLEGGTVLHSHGKEHRLEQHQRAHEVGPFHRQTQGDGAAEGMADHVDRPLHVRCDQIHGHGGADRLDVADPVPVGAAAMARQVIGDGCHQIIQRRGHPRPATGVAQRAMDHERLARPGTGAGPMGRHAAPDVLRHVRGGPPDARPDHPAGPDPRIADRYRPDRRARRRRRATRPLPGWRHRFRPRPAGPCRRARDRNPRR